VNKTVKSHKNRLHYKFNLINTRYLTYRYNVYNIFIFYYSVHMYGYCIHNINLIIEIFINQRKFYSLKQSNSIIFTIFIPLKSVTLIAVCSILRVT